MYVAIGRQRMKPIHTTMISETYDSSTPALAVELGRKMMGRKATPGWDDIHCEGWRSVKLPVHDMAGCTCYVCVFGTDFDPKRAQSVIERLALLLGPMIDGQIQGGDASALDAAEVVAHDASRTQQELAELHRVMEPILSREMQHANSSSQIEQIQNQLDDIKAIMHSNIETILDRQDQLEALEQKASDLNNASSLFRKNTRKLRRWHIMNQIKWGVAVGTLVTVSVAVPIVLLVAV